jgi:hypothetical protein
MNGSDLIVIGPWIIFAVCLVAVCICLLRARRPVRRSAQRSPQRSASAPRRRDD